MQVYVYRCCLTSVAQINFSFLQAVSKGYWVVFEDIDKAPSDVRSVILPLLEGANLFATGNGQVRRVRSMMIFSCDKKQTFINFKNKYEAWIRNPPTITSLKNVSSSL